jgi:hypothetical protein
MAALAALAAVVLLSAVGLRAEAPAGSVDRGDASVLAAGDTVGTPAPAVRPRAWSDATAAHLANDQGHVAR